MREFVYGSHSDRPIAGRGAGDLYLCTTHRLVYQTVDGGRSWASWGDVAAGGGGPAGATGAPGIQGVAGPAGADAPSTLDLHLMGWDGGTWIPVLGDATGRLVVTS